MLVHSSQMSTL